jgi:2-methylcitrate dehydratase
MGISHELATLVLDIKYDDLDESTRHQAKRVLLDGLANILGGCSSDAGRIVERTLKSLGGSPESTVIGSGIKLPCVNAAIINGTMLRYLDFMDTCAAMGPRGPQGAHPCENIPAILAVAEREHTNGRDAIAAIVAAYELTGRFCSAFARSPLAARGWHHSTFGQFIVPLVAGKLMGLDENQLVNAVGISGTHNATLEVVDSPGEEYNMTKNIVYPFAAASGIQAALLAKEGFTGPERVIEGEGGFAQSTVKRQCDLDKLRKNDGRPAIMDVIMKVHPVNILSGSVADCVLSLVQKNAIRAKDVVRVKVWVSAATEAHTNDPVKRHPKNKESADHSTPFIVAMAIIAKELTPSQYSPKYFADPLVNSLIDKVEMEADPEFKDQKFLGSKVEIELTSGAKFEERVDFPKGFITNPVSDDELIAKFRSITAQSGRQVDEQRIDQIVDAVFAFDELDDVGALMSLLNYD